MFPTFISIIDIQSWWEVPSIAHFCSLFRTAFNLLDFDIEDLEEALLTDGTEESSWLQELIVRLLSGCLPNNEISTFNYQMFLRRLFRQKCQEHDCYNPFNTDIDFQLLPLRKKVDILHSLCDFRLDADDVLEQLKNLEADSLRVEPLGYDGNDSAYWYFYGTRLYREDFGTKANKKKSVWQVICFTEDDWIQLTKKLKRSDDKSEQLLHQTLSENFMPEIPRLFKEKENLARRRLLENRPRRTSSRLRKLECEGEKEGADRTQRQTDEEGVKLEDGDKERKRELEKKRREAYERRTKLKEQSGEESTGEVSNADRHEMAGHKSKKSKGRQRRSSNSSVSSKDTKSSSKKPKRHAKEAKESSKSSGNTITVGRQTNNSLSAATGQILIQTPQKTNKKKLKTSQVFRQTDEDLQTGMHKILDYVKNHEDAWPFADPVEEEYAPNYYSIIRKPMDLQRMEDRLDAGYYKSFSKFQADFQLIVDNCRLYNGVENEYTEMVDNLLKVFERATEKYLDQISSSDDEIAIEYSNDSEKSYKKPKPISVGSKRKPMLAAQTDRKRERSLSEESIHSLDAYEINTKEKKPEKKEKEKPSKKHKNETKREKHDNKKENSDNKKDKSDNKKDKSDNKKDKSDNKKEKVDHKKDNKKSQKEGKKKVKKSNKKEKRKSPMRSHSRSRSPPKSNVSSPPPSWPPSSPDTRFDFNPKKTSKKRPADDLSDREEIIKGKQRKLSKYDDSHSKVSIAKDKISDHTNVPPSPKPKDKHNKLRETIEKLKAKSEIKLDFELDHPKENKDKNRKPEKEEKAKSKPKEKSNNLKQPSKNDIVDLDVEGNNTTDSVLSDTKKSKKVLAKTPAPAPPKLASNLDALTIATEQTLKDINKWLDDTPKFSEFSSASNSPSYAGLDEFDCLAKLDQATGKRAEKPAGAKKEGGPKEVKKRPFRDPSKFFKRREVQRTIDRLQPGKSKGNLITNVQSANKVDEIFPLGPLSKMKDAKNSLIVKTDTNAPKLSLGSVLDSFGKHNFVDDQKKEDQKILTELSKQDNKTEPNSEAKGTENKVDSDSKADKKEKDPEDSNGGATPNLSAWFKAFGAPKMQPPQKKTEIRPDGKENEKCDDPKQTAKVSIPMASPNAEPAPRQRKISTGSSVSERSSFSQDMDSPRVGIDERGAYPAPYPSPLHKSPSGASPIMASPRPDISPKAAAYPTINGQIRCGFYQDTVSNKSSPDKSCSPRDNVQASPYPHYSEHVYTPNSTESSYYSYANSPYYTHAPNYSNTNPTPPYNMEGHGSFYDTSKSLTDQYQAKNLQTYTANSPASNQSSPAHPQLSPHSPVIHPQHSPSINSQHSPSVNSQHSPSVVSQHSLSPHSPGVYAQPVKVPSPNLRPQPSPQRSPNVQLPNSPKEAPAAQAHDEDQARFMEKQQQQFPVKKRAYNESDRFEVKEKDTGYCAQKPMDPTPRDAFQMQIGNPQLDPSNVNNYPVGNPFGATFPPESNYPLNIPNARTINQQPQNKVDMSKYTNMGYTGPDVNFPRHLQDFIPARTTPGITSTGNPQLPQQQQQQQQLLPATAAAASQSDTRMRYNNPNASLQQMGYKSMEPSGSTPQQAHTNFNVPKQQAQETPGYKSTTFNAPEIEGALRGLSHVVDERMYYGEKTLGAAAPPPPPPHLFNKPIVTAASMFGQTMQGYGQGVQGAATTAVASMYGRQMEMQGQNEMKAAMQQPQPQERKSKKRKAAKGVSSSIDTQQQQHPQQAVATAQHQGFQSYAGLKATPSPSISSTPSSTVASSAPISSMEPSAISLKTSSVVPGSAFNFGPTPSALGLYGDKDAYPNFLDDFRSTPNYYMAAAAAAAHRTDSTAAVEKQPRPAQQTTSGYPAFLGAPPPPPPQTPQARAAAAYPIAGPFIPNQAAAQLMDTYQHYLPPGVLNQGLLGPPGAYPPPPGYHPALSIRQPYDAMTRPSWL